MNARPQGPRGRSLPQAGGSADIRSEIDLDLFTARSVDPRTTTEGRSSSLQWWCPGRPSTQRNKTEQLFRTGGSRWGSSDTGRMNAGSSPVWDTRGVRNGFGGVKISLSNVRYVTAKNLRLIQRCCAIDAARPCERLNRRGSELDLVPPISPARSSADH